MANYNVSTRTGGKKFKQCSCSVHHFLADGVCFFFFSFLFISVILFLYKPIVCRSSFWENVAESQFRERIGHMYAFKYFSFWSKKKTDEKFWWTRSSINTLRIQHYEQFINWRSKQLKTRNSHHTFVFQITKFIYGLKIWKDYCFVQIGLVHIFEASGLQA